MHTSDQPAEPVDPAAPAEPAAPATPAGAAVAAAPPARNPFLSIWIRPRATIRRLVDSGEHGPVLAIAAALGVVQVLDRASSGSLGDTLDLGWILLAAAVVGPLIGILGLYVGAALVGWSGRWIGGKADQPELRAAIAWGSVPVVATLPFWGAAVFAFGSDLFTTVMPRVGSNPVLALLMLLFGLEVLVLAVWSFVATLKTVGEVQGFSAWKAWGNLILAVLPFVALGILAAILIPLVAAG